MECACLLLWAESLAVSLLLVATVTACTARWASRGLRAFVLTLTLLLLLSVLAALTALAAVAYSYLPSFAWGLLATSALAGGFLIGTILIYVRGLRGRGGIVRASAWPGGRLAIAFVATVWMLVMTFWILDLSIRQQGASMQAKAAAILASVAQPHVADRDNALFDYKAAYEAFGSLEDLPDEWRQKWNNSSDPNGVDPRDPQLRAFLDGKAEALRLVRHGATRSGCDIEQNFDPTELSSLAPDLQWAHRLANLLCLSARVRAADGDANGAVEDINAIEALVEGVGSSPGTICMLVGIGIDGLAFQTMQSQANLGRLGARDLGRIRVDGSLSWHRQLQRLMVMEEVFRLGVLAGLAEGRYSLNDLTPTITGLSYEPTWGEEAVKRPVNYAYRLFILPEEVQANARLSAKIRELAALQYPQAADGWKKLQAQDANSCMGVVPQVYMPEYGQFTALAAEADARRAVLSTAVAACWYRTARNQCPGKIDDLVPEYLIVAPVDPFDGKGLRFKSDGDKVVIYSIGPDAVDDGGAAYDRRTKKGDIVFELRK
jgi:hypothetical protein